MWLRDWIDPLVFAYLLAMFIRTFVVELFKIPSGSMTPTLVGDLIAEIDCDNDGDDDLVIGRPDPRRPDRIGEFQYFKREAGEFLPGATEVVQSLPPRAAADFARAQRHRYDRICVNKMAYWFHGPERGDIVVFKVPRGIWQRDKPIYVKRLVGRPGELVEIRDHALWIDGARVEEPPVFRERFYVNECDRAWFDRRQLGEGEYLTFGDNTLSSSDGRKWGPVPEENFKGKAFFRYMPLSEMSFLD